MTKSAALKKAMSTKRHVVAAAPEANEPVRLMEAFEETEKEMEEISERVRAITQKRSAIVKSLMAVRGKEPFVWRGRRMTPVHRPRGKGGDIYFLRTPQNKQVEEIG